MKPLMHHHHFTRRSGQAGVKRRAQVLTLAASEQAKRVEMVSVGTSTSDEMGDESISGRTTQVTTAAGGQVIHVTMGTQTVNKGKNRFERPTPLVNLRRQLPPSALAFAQSKARSLPDLVQAANLHSLADVAVAGARAARRTGDPGDGPVATATPGGAGDVVATDPADPSADGGQRANDADANPAQHSVSVGVGNTAASGAGGGSGGGSGGSGGARAAKAGGSGGDPSHVRALRPAVAPRFATFANASGPDDLVPPLPYEGVPGSGSATAQAYSVQVHSNVVLVMDLHAHLVTERICGLLAGTYNHATRTAKVKAAHPCRTRRPSGHSRYDPQIHVDFEDESEAEVRARIAADGMHVVGWYTSRTAWDPVPSVRDLAWHRTEQAPHIRWGGVVGGGAVVENELGGERPVAAAAAAMVAVATGLASGGSEEDLAAVAAAAEAAVAGGVGPTGSESGGETDSSAAAPRRSTRARRKSRSAVEAEANAGDDGDDAQPQRHRRRGRPSKKSDKGDGGDGAGGTLADVAPMPPPDATLDGSLPFVSAIVSTYNVKNPTTASVVAWYNVNTRESVGALGQPMSVTTESVPDADVGDTLAQVGVIVVDAAAFDFFFWRGVVMSERI